VGCASDAMTYIFCIFFCINYYVGALARGKRGEAREGEGKRYIVDITGCFEVQQ